MQLLEITPQWCLSLPKEGVWFSSNNLAGDSYFFHRITSPKSPSCHQGWSPALVLVLCWCWCPARCLPPLSAQCHLSYHAFKRKIIWWSPKGLLSTVWTFCRILEGSWEEGRCWPVCKRWAVCLKKSTQELDLHKYLIFPTCLSPLLSYSALFYRITESSRLEEILKIRWHVTGMPGASSPCLQLCSAPRNNQQQQTTPSFFKASGTRWVGKIRQARISLISRSAWYLGPI